MILIRLLGGGDIELQKWSCRTLGIIAPASLMPLLCRYAVQASF